MPHYPHKPLKSVSDPSNNGDLPYRIVGTAGHIDHGKSALVRALTGTDPDRLQEEKERGITIDLGFADSQLGGFHIGFVDVPGHERFVKNMLAGVGGIDAVVLVVAADESVMPQTREHLAICELLGVRGGVVALTKCDLADGELAELAELEVSELLEGTSLQDSRIVRTSATAGTGLDELREALAEVLRAQPARTTTAATRLPIDRVFTIRGFGTVITGTLLAGEIATGDRLDVLPGDQKATVRGLQVHGAPAERATAGQRVAHLALEGLLAVALGLGGLALGRDLFGEQPLEGLAHDRHRRPLQRGVDRPQQRVTRAAGLADQLVDQRGVVVVCQPACLPCSEGLGAQIWLH